jgi:hypothetical protein
MHGGKGFLGTVELDCPRSLLMRERERERERERSEA